MLNNYDSSSTAKPVDMLLLLPRFHLDLVAELVIALGRHVLVLDRESEPVGSPD